MFFILSKILLFFIKPIIWIFILLIFAALAKKPLKRKKLVISSLIIFFIFSNNFLIGKIINCYEADYPVKQKYDVGILLGGYSHLNERNNALEVNWTGDRLFQTISLYKKGEIDKILISGGNANLINNKIKEADVVVKYLKEIGIPDSAILIENQSRNTVENAKNSLEIIKKHKPNAKILVITSAWHIPRAKIIFDKQSNSKISYYPTNFIGKTDDSFIDFIIPDATALSNWELMIKEWIGLAVSWIVG